MDITGIDLSGQTAVITGASRGIGREISQYLAKAGAKVVLMARNGNLLNEAVEEITSDGGEALAIEVDVGDPESIKTAFAKAADEAGPIDLLVNNAGISGTKSPVSEADPVEWWKTIEVNVRGVFLCSQAVVHSMRNRKSGRIINLASGLGLFPFPPASDYSVSKAALMRLTDTMAEELSEDKVVVFAISPGMVKTDMTRDLKEDNVLTKSDWTPVERAAELCVFLASGKADALSGRYIHARNDDVNELVQNAENIIEKDLQALRLST